MNETAPSFAIDDNSTNNINKIIAPADQSPMALGDLDRDGLADFVKATSAGIQIFFNNGDGTFGSQTLTISAPESAKSVQALAVAVPAKDGSGVRGLVWVANESGKTTTLNVLTY
jgi:hypothetical protein